MISISSISGDVTGAAIAKRKSAAARSGKQNHHRVARTFLSVLITPAAPALCPSPQKICACGGTREHRQECLCHFTPFSIWQRPHVDVFEPEIVPVVLQFDLFGAGDGLALLPEVFEDGIVYD